jgi:hypothetical protein
VAEFARILAPGGILVAYELDYGGLLLPLGDAAPGLITGRERRDGVVAARAVGRSPLVGHDSTGSGLSPASGEAPPSPGPAAGES